MYGCNPYLFATAADYLANGGVHVSFTSRGGRDIFNVLLASIAQRRRSLPAAPARAKKDVDFLNQCITQAAAAGRTGGFGSTLNAR